MIWPILLPDQKYSLSDKSGIERTCIAADYILRLELKGKSRYKHYTDRGKILCLVRAGRIVQATADIEAMFYKKAVHTKCMDRTEYK